MAPPSIIERISGMESLGKSFVKAVVAQTKAPDTLGSDHDSSPITLGLADFIYFGIIVALTAVIVIGLVFKLFVKKVQGGGVNHDQEGNSQQEEGNSAVNEGYKQDDEENDSRTKM